MVIEKMESKEVLIVGAGPTGLTLANLLATMGTGFSIIDKTEGPSKSSNAFGIHARSLEVFNQFGLSQKSIDAGKVDNTVHILVKGKQAVKIDVNEILPGETRYPYFLILQQNKTEQLLIDSLTGFGGDVLWNHELCSLEQKDQYVQVRIKGPEGVEQIKRFQYVVGCDGASSSVRQMAGFAFKGQTIPHTFYLADCELDWDYPHSDVYFIFAPHYLTAVFSFREKNRYRVFNFLNGVVNKQQDDDLSSREMQQILDSDPYLKLKAKNTDWASVFKIHTRYTGKFSEGRIFLAGDAAHVHSPAGAQGMNTGIQDAYNLAWKLNFVLKNYCHPQLLDTYNEERHSIARKLHNTTDRFFKIMITKNAFINFFRMHVFPFLFKSLISLAWLRKRNIRRLSQISINYRFSSLNGAGHSADFLSNAPRTGDRAPFSKINLPSGETDVYCLFKCTHFTLLIACEAEENDRISGFTHQYTDQWNVPVNRYLISRQGNDGFYKTYGVKQQALFIIRPDDHIAYRASSFDPGEIRSFFESLRSVKTTFEPAIQRQL